MKAISRRLGVFKFFGWNPKIIRRRLTHGTPGQHKQHGTTRATRVKQKAKFSVCTAAAHVSGLTRSQARDVIERQVTIVRESWDDVRDHARLTEAGSRVLLGRQVLNPYAFTP